MKIKTDAALIDHFGEVVAQVCTVQPSGPCRYYSQVAIFGMPVNTKIGKLSRSCRNLERAARIAWHPRLRECGYHLCKAVGNCAAE